MDNVIYFFFDIFICKDLGYFWDKVWLGFSCIV